MLTTSAPSRLPAISNDSSVRVEFSKKALIWVSPARRLVMLRRGAVHADPLLGLVEQEHDLVRLKPGDAEEVPMRKNGAALDLGAGAVVDLVHRRGRLAGKG